MSDYVAKVFPGNEIDHGDVVHFKPENAVIDAGLGYEGFASSALDDRFDFNENGRVVWPNTYWDDLRVPVQSVKVQGVSNAPDWDEFLTGLQLLWFDNSTMEQVFFVLQMPHGWKEGTNLHPHVHWVPSINGVQEAHTVQWGLEYSWANYGVTFSSTTTITGNTTLQDEQLVANRHYKTGIGDIVATSKTFSSMLVCRLFRDATNDDYTGEAGLLEVDLHYEIDSPGSRDEFTQ